MSSLHGPLSARERNASSKMKDGQGEEQQKDSCHSQANFAVRANAKVRRASKSETDYVGNLAAWTMYKSVLINESRSELSSHW